MQNEVSKLYSDALFELCIEQDCLEKVYKELNFYYSVFNENPDLIKLLSSPTIDFKDKISIINKIFDDDGMSFDYLCLIAEKNRISIILNIIENFKLNYNKHLNIQEVSVTSSISLTDELRGKLKLKLSEKLKKKIILVEKIDPEIIGGIIIDYDNVRIDNSIKTKLSEIRVNLYN